jgi:formate-dependent nitrite reductase cytochrome c552 subunit
VAESEGKEMIVVSSEPSKPSPEASVTSIQTKEDLGASSDPNLIRSRMEADRATARRIVETEMTQLLPVIRKARLAADQLKQLQGMARWAGDEKADLCLGKILSDLVAAASD